VPVGLEWERLQIVYKEGKGKEGSGTKNYARSRSSRSKGGQMQGASRRSWSRSCPGSGSQTRLQPARIQHD